MQHQILLLVKSIAIFLSADGKSIFSKIDEAKHENQGIHLSI